MSEPKRLVERWEEFDMAVPLDDGEVGELLLRAGVDVENALAELMAKIPTPEPVDE